MTARILVVIGLTLGVAAPMHAQGTSALTISDREHAIMTHQARGTFDVKLTPQPMHSTTGGAQLGRMTIDKQFHGELEGTSAGEMLSAMTAVAGSAGYVAMELVTGALNGRKGTFVLQHTATMTPQGAPSLSVTVVPNSGTDELVGLSGQLEIIIEKGQHSYRFDYALAPGPG